MARPTVRTRLRAQESGELPPALLQGARRAFLRHGVQKTTMSDIADEVGVARPALYEFVSSRNDLIDAVLVDRIRAVIKKLVRTATDASSFAEAVVETSVQAVELTRNDRELTNIFATAPHLRVHQVMEGSNAAMTAAATEFLRPIIEHGVREGVLRPDVSDELLVDWFRAVYSGFIYREQVEPEEVRTLVRTFLLASISRRS